jgi:ABC-type uncharacterized transport system substrate-binding protein
MRRREFIAFFGGAFPALLVRAQERQGIHRIGFIALVDSFAPGHPLKITWDTLESRLSELGWREGHNLSIERRHAHGDQKRYAEAADALVDSRVEVVVAFGMQPITALLAANPEIPIVAYTGDPVKLGLAASYARPGRNVTGVASQTPDLAMKQLELLRDVKPGLARVAWLNNPSNQFFARSGIRELIEQAGAKLGVNTVQFDVGSAERLEGAIREIGKQGFQAVLIPADISYVRNAKRLSDLLIASHLVSASQDMVMAQSGVLVTYGPDVLDGVRRMADHIDRILRGTRPGEIPIEFVRRFRLAVNAKTARALGLTIPQSVLLRADRVIE